MRSSRGRAFAAAVVITLLGFTGFAAAPRVASAQPRETTSARSGSSSGVERVDSLGGITEYRLKSNGMNILLVLFILFLRQHFRGSNHRTPRAG